MKTQAIDFKVLMTQDIQMEAYDLYGAVKKRPAITAGRKHVLILKKHPHSHVAGRFGTPDTGAALR